MNSLNAQWLKIELDSVDETARGWSEAVRVAYEASIKAVAQDQESKRQHQNSDKAFTVGD